MENTISISTLNDFIFCPYSIYLHNVYMDTDEGLYHAIPQTRGKIAHQSIDSKYFLDNGYNVECIDGSLELSKLASEYLGIDVKCMYFSEFDEISKYDGVWACASLLHVNRLRLKEALINSNVDERIISVLSDMAMNKYNG